MVITEQDREVQGRGATPCRLGIMGGTFDPIHVGHLVLAEQVRETLGLDKVLFVPTGNPHFKLDQQVRPAAERLKMVELAIANNPFFEASDLEVLRKGVTYTRDTLAELAVAYPDAQLFFIMGSDSLVTLHHWKYADELPRYATFVGVNRPGHAPADEAVVSQLEAMGFAIRLVEGPALDVSSSGLRARLAAGRSIRYLVPDAVADYIERTHLYIQEEE